MSPQACPSWPQSSAFQQDHVAGKCLGPNWGILEMWPGISIYNKTCAWGEQEPPKSFWRVALTTLGLWGGG